MSSTHLSSDASVEPRFEYAFSLRGDLNGREIGSNPVGTLIDIDYINLEAHTKPSSARPFQFMGGAWSGLDGEVIAGSDWATLRPDGVLEFNGRLTLQADQSTREARRKEDAQPDVHLMVQQLWESRRRQEKEPKPLLINVVVSGVVDLLVGYPDGVNRQQVFKKLRSDGGLPSLPLTLTVRFELAQTSEPWAAEEFPTAGFGRYAGLAVSPFIACGVVWLKDRVPCKVALDILRIVPNRPSYEPSAGHE